MTSSSSGKYIGVALVKNAENFKMKFNPHE